MDTKRYTNSLTNLLSNGYRAINTALISCSDAFKKYLTYKSRPNKELSPRQQQRLSLINFLNKKTARNVNGIEDQ